MIYPSLPENTKKPINLSLNAKTVETAKALGMNLSQAVDQWLGEEVKRRYWAQWNEDNREAIAEYNARIAKYGLPLAKYRTWGQSLGDGQMNGQVSEQVSEQVSGQVNSQVKK